MRLTHRIANPSAKAVLAFGLTLATLPFCLTCTVLAQAGASSGKPQRVRTQLEGFDLSPKSGKSANQIGGASRDIGTPKLFAPNSGKAYSATPDFHWAGADAGAKVTFRLSTLDGQTLFETVTPDDHLRYPADAPALTPGMTYRWTIVPENDILGGPPKPITFVVVSGAEREAIQNELKSASNPSAAASVFVKHRIWYDAVQSYTDVLEHSPDDSAARAARGELYDQLPVTKALADADWRMVH